MGNYIKSDTFIRENFSYTWNIRFIILEKDRNRGRNDASSV